jgi:hypothetical protein
MHESRIVDDSRVIDVAEAHFDGSSKSHKIPPLHPSFHVVSPVSRPPSLPPTRKVHGFGAEVMLYLSGHLQVNPYSFQDSTESSARGNRLSLLMSYSSSADAKSSFLSGEKTIPQDRLESRIQKD